MLIHQTSIFTQPLLYLDPGSGSIIVQLILAALLGIGVTLRLFWSKISAFFGGKESVKMETTEEGDDE